MNEEPVFKITQPRSAWQPGCATLTATRGTISPFDLLERFEAETGRKPDGGPFNASGLGTRYSRFAVVFRERVEAQRISD